MFCQPYMRLTWGKCVFSLLEMLDTYVNVTVPRGSATTIKAQFLVFSVCDEPITVDTKILNKWVNQRKHRRRQQDRFLVANLSGGPSPTACWAVLWSDRSELSFCLKLSYLLSSSASVSLIWITEHFCWSGPEWLVSFQCFFSPQEFLVSLTLCTTSWCWSGPVLNGITERENRCFLSWYPAP